MYNYEDLEFMNTKNIGIIGTGHISAALVTGFCTDEESRKNIHFYLSPRNRENSAKLAEEYPENVTVCESNQEVLDQRLDWVILAVRPQLAEEIIRPLHFSEDVKVLSLISDHSATAIKEWTGPTERTVRMVPLPFAALHIGPIAYYPADQEIHELFAPLGQLIELADEDTLNSVFALTALMSPYYLLIHHTVEWGKAHNLSDRASLDYMTSFFGALSVMANNAEDSEAVAELCYRTTKGGLNEYAYKHISETGGYERWIEALDGVKARLDKKN